MIPHGETWLIAIPGNEIEGLELANSKEMQGHVVLAIITYDPNGQNKTFRVWEKPFFEII